MPIVIMDKNRRYIATGWPRNRYLTAIKDMDPTKRVMVYKTKLTATTAFKTSGFWDQDIVLKSYGTDELEDCLEAVDVTFLYSFDFFERDEE